jgi:hypothetical protein
LRLLKIRGSVKVLSPGESPLRAVKDTIDAGLGKTVRPDKSAQARENEKIANKRPNNLFKEYVTDVYKAAKEGRQMAIDQGSASLAGRHLAALLRKPNNAAGSIAETQITAVRR